MNFYHEWEARHRHDELQRDARRRASWNLENGLTERAPGVWGFVAHLFGVKRPGEAVIHVSTREVARARYEGGAKNDRKRAS